MLDQAPVQTAPPSAETTAPASVSTPKPGLLSGLVQRFAPKPRDPEVSGEEPTTEVETLSPDAPVTDPVTPPPSTVSTADRWDPPATREDHERAVQAEVDRRDDKRRRDAAQQAEAQRQQSIVDAKTALRTAREQYGATSLEFAEAAEKVDDLERGIERDWNDAQTRDQLYTTASLQAARATHTAAFSPLLHGLPDAEVNELGTWFKTQTTPDAHGRPLLPADEALSKLAQKITEARDEHIRQGVVDGLFDEIKTDPELRQQLRAILNGGDFEEPEHLVGGSPAGLPSDDDLSHMSTQQFRALNLSPAAKQRLLMRPNRN